LAALHSRAVDYVKTGLPAELPKRLKPNKWPHFMEKKYRSKDAVYHSEKILGQLYDRVERVNFVPQWQKPFDKRILNAYKLDDNLLKSARQIKRKYDTAMRRIMAQQEIRTEFEVWSTFVLSRPRVGSDYKLQEVVSGISGTLKEQFRNICIESAGSKDFPILGPFVAAMYRVTKEELDIALAECRMTKVIGGWDVPKRRMEPESMPLISFPWLFDKELGRIATGVDTTYDLDDFGLISLISKNNASHARERQARGEVDVEDYVQQDDGIIVHRGEELILFPDVESEDLLGDDYAFTGGESGEAIPRISFMEAESKSPTQREPYGDSGMEDMIPRTELDGFLHPCTVARPAHDMNQGPLVGRLIDDDHDPSDSSAEFVIVTACDSLSHSFVDLGLSNSSVPAKAVSEANEEIMDEGEIIEEHFDLEESPLERLARLYKN